MCDKHSFRKIGGEKNDNSNDIRERGTDTVPFSDTDKQNRDKRQEVTL